MNKLFALLLLSASLAFAYSGGDGSYENPYQVASVEDWELLCSDVNLNGNNQSGVYFIQTADISFAEDYTWEMYRCGLPSAPFKGNYDGDGYYFSNLFITATLSSTATTNAFGLFGYCEEATIENVSVYGRINVSADYNANACVGVGGVIGISVKGLFAGLHNYVDIDVKISNAPTGQASNGNIKYGVGGVLGLNAWTTNSGTLHIGCENYGNIYVDGANGETCVGGCFTANVPNSGTDTTFSGWNNYGKVVVNGMTESSQGNNSCVAGIGSFHHTANSLSRTPKIIGCSNFGDVICSNAVSSAGVAVKGVAYGNQRIYCEASTNYADVVKVSNHNQGKTFTAGISVDQSSYSDSVCINCVNFGKITAYGSGTSLSACGGIQSGTYGTTTLAWSYGNKNFGVVDVNCPNAQYSFASGISSLESGGRLYACENYGEISSVAINPRVAGVYVSSSLHQRNHISYDCVNFGKVYSSSSSSSSSSCVISIPAGVGSNTRDVIVSNCYNLGEYTGAKDGTFGAIVGVANTYGSYGISVKNCYAIVGEGENLIGAVDASNGQVSLENCVGIKNGREGGIAYSVIGSNNWSQANTTLVSYDDCYHDTSLCYGNLFSGTFYPAEKSADFFDLILPMNTQLYPTPSAEGKKNHNYTKAQGYKRYIRTITNNQ